VCVSCFIILETLKLAIRYRRYPDYLNSGRFEKLGMREVNVRKGGTN
jgi:hypothetical protein